MKEERFFYAPKALESSELPEQEAQHALRVLRLCEGDDMYLMDGNGTFYHATVNLASKKHCLYEIKDTMPQQKTWNGEIRLAIAPTKMMERIEWMAEKTTEIGVDAISFVDCKFSERHTIKAERIERIVISAMKQSRKAFKPVVNDMTSLKEFISRDDADYKFIAHCYNESQRVDFFNRLQTIDSSSSVSILVGPEGDFSTDEVNMALEAGYEPVTLGNSRLRTETAGLMAVTMAQISKRLI